MLLNFIKEHLEFLENKKEEGIILVYKGFSNIFIQEISKSIPYIGNLTTLIGKDGKINLNHIYDQKPIDFLKLVESRKRNEINFFLYEELINIIQKVNNINDFIDKKIIVIENDLTSFYMNQTSIVGNDTEASIEKSEINSDKMIFDNFYANCKIIDQSSYIQYKTLDDITENIYKISFFETITLDTNVEFSSGKEGCIEIKSDLDDEDYIKFINGSYAKDGEIIFCYEPNNKNIDLFNKLNTFGKVNSNQIFFQENGFNFYKKNYRDELAGILKSTWGYESFRDLDFYKNPDLNNKKINISQGELIEDIISQTEKAKNGSKDYSDIFITAPTGAGKSILFQLPALYLQNKYQFVTIVVSPLIALMYDQVNNLKKKGVTSVEYINSEKSLQQREEIIENVKNGKISILYLSPELLLSYDITHFIGERELGMIVIDEAHLVTTWGRDFRIDYWYLGSHLHKIRKYKNTRFITVALTATAVYGGADDMVFETFDALKMIRPHKYIGNILRDNINFDFQEFIYEGTYTEERYNKTKERIVQYIIKGEKIIVYFPYTSQIKEIQKQLAEEGYGDKICTYFGSDNKENKQNSLEKFSKGEIKVILATKAFGMGVDISDINTVYHHAPSGSVPDYVQEIGRIARDKNMQGLAVIDYCKKDLSFGKALHGLSAIKQYECKFMLDKIYQIYELKNKNKKIAHNNSKEKFKLQQNFLVSLEDFSFIFEDEKDSDRLENRVKNVLLLIEKDLIRKYKGIPVIIARPKQLFTKVFASVESSIESSFIAHYGKYAEKIQTIDSNLRKDRFSRSVSDFGNIFKIDLAKLWEEKFPEKSFPLLKKEFYEKTLFTDIKGIIIPRYRLSITLRKKSSETKEDIFNYFTKLEEIFSQQKFLSNFVKERDIEEDLALSFGKEMGLRMKEVLINFYTSNNSFGKSGGFLGIDNFIQQRKDTFGNRQFRIVNRSLGIVKNAFLKHFDNFFPMEDGQIYDKYISSGSNNHIESKIACVIELLNLGSYQTDGGEHPQIFIRINDPFRVRKIVENGYYANSIVDDIERRYKNSLNIIDTFFTRLDNNERWPFIENYFLGKDLTIN